VEIPVIIEPVAGAGYRAIGAGGLSSGLTADGPTAAEAMDRLAVQVQARVNSGAKLADLSMVGNVAPWTNDSGCLRDEPLYDAWRAAMEENRRKLDEDPEAL
jgi:hypothetical protein